MFVCPCVQRATAGCFTIPHFSSRQNDSSAHPPPQRSPHKHGVFIAHLERSYFTFMAKLDECKSNNVGIPNSPSVYANYHRYFTLMNGFDNLWTKKNWIGKLVNVPLDISLGDRAKAKRQQH
ncbi:hypothetical protein AVEN_170231-1 [Araneus ventricosus]|uniref:Uncharacterized protein n=1 Tax=Araneus ventricosus TaxID=182803 RepID=A0A4Y2KBM5_ARAVE|nr:hypothetical protein AVEN_170231-1 [Araneus ventricosus]